MNYDMIDFDRTGQEVIKGRVVDTAVVAYQHGLELRRLKAHADAGDANAKLMLTDAAANAKRARRRAERAAGTDTNVPSIHRAVQEALMERMSAIKQQAEGTHAQHSQMKAERERILAMDESDPLAPTADERDQIEQNLRIHDAHIKDAETVHALVSVDLDALAAKMEPADSAPDTSDADIAEALAAETAALPGSES